MSKLNADASDAAVQEDALEFIKQHQNDKDFMVDLLTECVKVQFADPWFQSHKAALADLALKTDPDCKRDPTVCTD